MECSGRRRHPAAKTGHCTGNRAKSRPGQRGVTRQSARPPPARPLTARPEWTCRVPQERRGGELRHRLQPEQSGGVAWQSKDVGAGVRVTGAVSDRLACFYREWGVFLHHRSKLDHLLCDSVTACLHFKRSLAQQRGRS